ncbi:MAG: MATE family efflux transporter [Cyclobacteriaceae bacterium]|nr:MATE family efflux transporter [Cyclobacteriaceae bacterium]MCK5277929.1 MATE family efflux transporter [Cyclobacteriaceae bacterium]
MSQLSQELGTENISKLLIKQSLPASVGFLIMSIYSIVDTIYVGHWIGPLAIGAITVVMPITFLISSIGMAIGVGGASIITRALGGKDRKRALKTFGNMVNLTLHFAIVLVIIGFILDDEILRLFGGKGDILPYAKEYFRVLLVGVPFLAWAMMSNNVIRAQGRPKVAMLVMVIPAIINIILDPIFIIVFKMGLAGAAWATTISYFISASYAIYYFLKGDTEINFIFKYFKLDLGLIREIFAIGSITLARQGSISLLIVVLNHSLYFYAGEMGITVYGIVNRVMMFALFPIIGIVQGFLPIAGYNYGANKTYRVKLSINTSIRYAMVLATCILIVIFVFSDKVVTAFTTDASLINDSSFALIFVFMMSPLIAVQMVGSGYFQAIGKALPALLLTMTKQGFFLIPLVLILPKFYGVNGIWYSFPIADILSASVTWFFLQKEIKNNLLFQPGSIANTA